MQMSQRKRSTTENFLGMTGEPDTEKLVCPVQRETHGNQILEIQALCVYSIMGILLRK